MTSAGIAQVEAARQDGRWDAAYAPQSTVTVPDDFQRALDANPKANEFFAALKSSERYSFLYRIHDAKRPETRARRINEYVAMSRRWPTTRRSTARARTGPCAECPRAARRSNPPDCAR